MQVETLVVQHPVATSANRHHHGADAQPVHANTTQGVRAQIFRPRCHAHRVHASKWYAMNDSLVVAPEGRVTSYTRLSTKPNAYIVA